MAKRYVNLSGADMDAMAKAFGCTRRMVVKALTFCSDSQLSQRMRYVAVKEYGAKIMVQVPECDTMYIENREGERVMIQVYGNGTRLEANLSTGRVETWYADGVPYWGWDNVSLKKFNLIQQLMEEEPKRCVPDIDGLRRVSVCVEPDEQLSGHKGHARVRPYRK